MNSWTQIALQVGPYAVSIAIFAACFCLYLKLWAAVQALERPKPEDSGHAEEMQRLRARLDELHAHVQRLTSPVQAQVLPAPPAPRPPINLARRTQVLRAHRRGDPTTEIASGLGLRRGEVDLIVKLDGLVLTSDT